MEARSPRSWTRRFAALLTGLAALGLLMPVAAAAGPYHHRSHHERGAHGHHGHHRGEGVAWEHRTRRQHAHRHHPDHPRQHRSQRRAHAPARQRRGDRHLHRGHHERSVRNAFYCAPCRRYFRARRAFHDHLHHHHRVPIWRLPGVIVRSVLGWVFYG